MNSGRIIVCGVSAFIYWWSQSLRQGEASGDDTVWIGSDVFRPLEEAGHVSLDYDPRGIGFYAQAIKAELGLPPEAPLHILIADPGCRTSANDLVCHTYSGELPNGSLYTVRKGLYVTSPECTLAMIAGILPRPDLIETAYELCGAYTFDADGGYLGCAPLMTKASLACFVDATTRFKGSKDVRSILAYLADNSGSQRETLCSILLGMPRNKGCQGLGIPALNKPLPCDGHGYVPDFTWDNVVADYDGGTHDDPEQVARDKLRRNAIQANQKHHVVLVREHFSNLSSLLGVGGQIRRLEHKRAWKPTPEEHEKLEKTFAYFMSARRRDRLMRFRTQGIWE